MRVVDRILVPYARRQQQRCQVYIAKNWENWEEEVAKGKS